MIWVLGSDVSPGLCVSCGCFSASGPVSSCQPVVSTTCAVDCAPPAQLPARLDRSRQLSPLQLCAAAAAVRQQRVSAGLSCPSWPTVGPSAIRSRCSYSLPQVSSARFIYTPLCVGIQLASLARSPSLLAASRQTCLATSSTCVRQGPLLTSHCSASPPRAHQPGYIAVTFARADPLVHPRSSIASPRAVSTTLSNFFCSVGSYLLIL